MINHNKQFDGRETDARAWTAEIEAATNAELTADTGLAGRNEGQDLGRKVIASGALENERKADQLLRKDERELTEAEDFVGEETQKQVGERLADDRADLMTEMGQGLALENRILAKTQEGVAKLVAPKVEQLVGQASYRPADLMRLYRQGVNETLSVFNRRIGDRN